MGRKSVAPVLALAMVALAGCGSSDSTSKTSVKVSTAPGAQSAVSRPGAFTPEPARSTPTDSPAYRSYVARLLNQRHQVSAAAAVKIAACETRKYVAAGYKTVGAIDAALYKDRAKFTRFGEECGLLAR